MASRWSEIVIDAHDPGALARFWAEVLGYSVIHDEPNEVEIGPWEREPEDLAERMKAGVQPTTLLFTPVPEAKTVKNRLHIDLRPIDRTTEEEAQRLEALGATRIDIGQGDVPWIVMADPEGNEFCVLRSLA